MPTRLDSSRIELPQRRFRRRGSAMLYAALVMTLLLGVTAGAVDWGRIQLAKSQLQQAADAAARYAATGLGDDYKVVQSRAAAAIAENRVDNTPIVFNATTDVEFGIWDQSTRKFTVVTGNARNSATAVRVTASRDATHGGRVGLFFGAFVGKTGTEVRAQAVVTRGKPTTLEIPAKASPWLAGAGAGATIPATDGNPTPSTAANNSPPQVTGIKIKPGESLIFRQTGGTTSYTDAGSYGPDGNADFDNGKGVAQAAVNGINTTRAPLNALMGIFLDDRAPNTYPMAAPGDFSSPGSRNFKTLAPPLKQVFFIGDGLDNAGKLQEFIVPPGATRLYLGIMDEKGWWWDNTDSLTTTLMNNTITTVK